MVESGLILALTRGEERGDERGDEGPLEAKESTRDSCFKTGFDYKRYASWRVLAIYWEHFLISPSVKRLR